jgi:hypothetical protein
MGDLTGPSRFRKSEPAPASRYRLTVPIRRPEQPVIGQHAGLYSFRLRVMKAIQAAQVFPAAAMAFGCDNRWTQDLLR